MLWITFGSGKDYESGNVEIGQICNGQGSLCPNIRHFAFCLKWEGPQLRSSVP